MVCSTKERTIICEYNRLIFIDEMWDSNLARYDYALCHGCGLVYATQRPEREEYDFLYDNFNEFLIKKKGIRSLSQSTFSQAAKDAIDNQFLNWRDLQTNGMASPVRKRLARHLNNARFYIPYIVPYLNLSRAKLLHIRAKSSTLAEYMRSEHGLADADLITLFPGHKYLAEKNGWVRAECCLDYENFVIPFDRKYNLIIENHILIHMLDSDKTFKQFREHIEDGGLLFLEKELADDRMFLKGKNIFAELRPFHFQQFDLPTVKRMLRRYGFSAISVDVRKGKKSEILGAAQYEPGKSEFQAIGDHALRQRLKMYRQWRDESILSISADRANALFGGELDAIWRRVKASGRLRERMWTGIPAFRPFAEAKVPQIAIEMFCPERGIKLPRENRHRGFRSLIAQALATAGLRRQPPVKSKKEGRSKQGSVALD